MFMRILMVLIGLSCLIACSGNSPTSNSLKEQVSGTGNLQGKVSIGPICPVETQENPCLPDPSLYTGHKLIILKNDGTTVKQVDIDGQGNYRTELPAGSYKVDFAPHDIGLPGSYQPPSVEIRSGQTTILNIEIDTGIR